MPRHPVPAGDSKLDGTPWLHAWPPYSQWKRPSPGLGHLLLLGILLRNHFPFLNHFSFLFFCRLATVNELTAEGGGGGRAGRGWAPKASLDDCPLALTTRRSRKPFLLFRAISSSSSELSSTQATISLGKRTTNDLSSSPSESET